MFVTPVTCFGGGGGVFDTNTSYKREELVSIPLTFDELVPIPHTGEELVLVVGTSSSHM